MVPDGRKATAREWLAWVPSALRMIEAANREIDDLNEQLNDIAHLVPEEFETDIAQTAIITNYIEHLQALSSAPTGLTVKEKIDALIDGAQELFAEAFECKHSYSEPCGSCMNTGISAMDKDEFDFAVAVHDLAAIGRRYRNDAILESSSAPTPEMEN